MLGKFITCSECHEWRQKKANNLCNNCYNRHWRNDHPEVQKPIVICSECGSKRSHGARGLCVNCYQRHRREDPEIVKLLHAREQRYRRANKEKAQEASLRWAETHTKSPFICSECGQERKHMAKGLCRPCYGRGWYQANRDKARASALRRPAAARERARETVRLWHEANPERTRENGLRWRAANPMRTLQYSQRRKALKRALPATLTVEQWTAILVAYKHRCAYCGRGDLKLTQDHVIPVSKGGAYEIGNIIPACGPCNSGKRDRDIPKPVQTLLL